MKKWLSLIAVCLIASNVSAATLSSADKETVDKLFADRTMTTISMVTLNDKLTNNTVTAYFGKDGKVVGQLATQPKDGHQGDQGTWTVKPNGNLCITWEHWQGGKQNCVDVYKTNNMVIFVNAMNGKFESAALIEYFREGDEMN